MRKLFQKLFRGGKNEVQHLREKQLQQAQTMQLEHQLSADYHQAMANMYRDQQLRLTVSVRVEGTAAGFEKLQADFQQGGAA